MRLLFLALAAATSLAACESEMPAPPPKDERPAIPAGAKVVLIAQRELICMANDQYLGKPQQPVELAGRTYFGCCATCKERLQKNEALRAAKDPVSGRSLDKADAVLGMTAKGDIIYFESEATLRRYND